MKYTIQTQNVDAETDGGICIGVFETSDEANAALDSVQAWQANCTDGSRTAKVRLIYDYEGPAD